MQATGVDNITAEQLIHDLVAIPSPSGEEAEAVQHLVNWMQTHGYDEAYVDEVGNAVGIIGQGNAGCHLAGAY